MSFGGSTGSSDGSSAYARHGQAVAQKLYSGAAGLSGIINGNLTSSVAPNTANKIFLDRMINFDGAVPGDNLRQSIGSIGDPYSSDYAANTQNAFNYRLTSALSRAQSGAENFMAPLERGKSFRESEVISDQSRNRTQELQQQTSSDMGNLIAALNTYLGQRLGASAQYSPMKIADSQSLNTAAQLLGPEYNFNQENFDGTGNQNSSGYTIGGGLNACCFIFLESYNSKLPWWVRVCRDEFVTKKRRDGYNRMAAWLVPLMRQHPEVRAWVNQNMVLPLTFWGGYYKRVSGFEGFRSYQRVVKQWFQVWDQLGDQ